MARQTLEGIEMATTQSGTTIHVQPIRRETVELAVIGLTPIIPRAMSEKAARELLLPSGRKTTADRAASLKHDPIAEFRTAAPIMDNDDAPTYLAVSSTAFKGAMMTAALDLPGARKAQIGRLVFVEGEQVPIYGHPKLLMSVVRSADMNRTPDIRTRVIVPTWAARVRVTFVVPAINETSVVNLLSAAGITAGVGDWRAEKGKGDYGQFILTDPKAPDYLALLEIGRSAQIVDMNLAEPYDRDTAELLSWFEAETGKRGLHVVEERAG
jgi:hypothetical protein